MSCPELLNTKESFFYFLWNGHRSSQTSTNAIYTDFVRVWKNKTKHWRSRASNQGLTQVDDGGWGVWGIERIWMRFCDRMVQCTNEFFWCQPTFFLLYIIPIFLLENVLIFHMIICKVSEDSLLLWNLVSHQVTLKLMYYNKNKSNNVR